MPTSYASTVLNASADTVWSYVRDFANLDEWLPSIETCEIEGGGDATAVGAVRKLTAQGDASFRERLVSFDDAARAYAYEFLDSPLPVRNYRSEIRVAAVTDSGQAFVEWSGEFDADDKDAEAMSKFFTKNVYGAGLDSLRKRYG
jgi:Polyketide cyclase / dehydrase and lipid transport